MLVGRSQIDITPAPGTELSGFVARVQPSVGVHDPLHARALFLSEGEHRLLWLHADLIGFERDFVLRLQDSLSRRLGPQPAEIVLSATHTHSGPPTVHLANCGHYDAGYVAWLEGRLHAAAAAAPGQVEEAQPVFAEGRCELAIDRRGKPTRHADPRVGVVGWKRSDGAYLAVLANYAMHNVAMGPGNRLVSADVAGRAAQRITDQLPGRPVVLLTNGAAGNLNPPAVGDDFGQMEAWGDGLAAAVTAALGHAEPLPDDHLRVAVRTVNIPLAHLSGTEIGTIADRQRGYLAGRDDCVARRCRDAADRWEQEMRRSADNGTAPRSAPLEVQVISLGAVTFVGFGAEVFSVMADDLREAAGRRVYVVGYANGLLGYLAPRAAYAEGGYETEGAFIFYGSPPVAPGGFEPAREAAVELARGVLRG
jgi:hypothetical protein